MTTTLTRGELTTLKQCEEVIERHIGGFIEVGRALLTIQVEKLYTDVSETFEGYVKKRFGLNRNRAYQFIESTKAADDVRGLQVEIKPSDNGRAPNFVGALPTNEAQARELAKVAKSADRAKVMEAAVKSAKIKDGVPQLTAGTIRKAAKELGVAKAKQPKAIPKKKPAFDPAILDQLAPSVRDYIEAGKGKLPTKAELKKLAEKSKQLQINALVGVTKTHKTWEQAVTGKGAPDVDALGTELTKAQSELLDSSVFDEMVTLLKQYTKLANSIRGKRGAWLILEQVREHAEKLLTLTRDAIPKVLCPSCEGKGCDQWCRNSGVMPAWVLTNYKAKNG